MNNQGCTYELVRMKYYSFCTLSKPKKNAIRSTFIFHHIRSKYVFICFSVIRAQDNKVTHVINKYYIILYRRAKKKNRSVCLCQTFRNNY